MKIVKRSMSPKPNRSIRLKFRKTVWQRLNTEFTCIWQNKAGDGAVISCLETRAVTQRLPEAIVELVDELGPQATRELLGVFISHVEETLRQLERVEACNDLPELRRIAHTIKGTAGCYGAAGLCDEARRLERACQEGDNFAACALIPSFAESCSCTLAFYTAVVSPWASSSSANFVESHCGDNGRQPHL